MTTEARESDAIEQIGRAADEADLVMLAAGRMNRLRAVLLGSPAERVLRISRRPALVVKRAPSLPSVPYRRMVVPVRHGRPPGAC